MTGAFALNERILFGALLVAFLSGGCAGLKPRPVPVETPAGYLGVARSAQAGFRAVYSGELRIWFHSIPALWYVAVTPGGTSVVAAVLNQTGVKIMELRGRPDARVCTVAIPAADRLRPYGEALCDGLWWSLAAAGEDGDLGWLQQGDEVRGTGTRDKAQARYRAAADDGTLDRVEVREDGRRRYTIYPSDMRMDADRTYPGRLRIECAQPRCRLDLTLKSLRWNDKPEETLDEAGP